MDHKKSGMLLPPPPKQTGPLPALARSTAHLPPPPQRDPSGRLPAPRAQTGRLPVPAGDAPAGIRPTTEDEPMTRELPVVTTPDAATPPPAFTPPPTASTFTAQGAPPPKFTPPPSFTPDTEPAARPAVPVPDFKPLFGYDSPEDASAASGLADAPGTSAPPFDPTSSGESLDTLEGAEGGSTSVAQLKEEIELLTQERDQANAELELARGKGVGASDDKLAEDLATANRERDEARMEVIVLRSRVEAGEQKQRDTDAMASQLEELSHVIDERDSVRRDYASLREQFETLKLDRSQLDSHEANQVLQDEIKQLRDQLASRGPGAPAPTGATGPTADVAALREQVKQSKEEASLAHRGLALSQKALQETREALREATDGSSSTKGNLEEAKKERAGLVRQNQLLQGQVDQLTREISAAKAKLAAKGA
jgi:hypothetical protein